GGWRTGADSGCSAGQEAMGSILSSFSGGRERRCMVLLLFALSIGVESRAQLELSPAVDRSMVDPLPAKIHLVDGNDIRFRRLSASAGLSQTRVGSIVQDKVGFIWLATQYGLNRYDGYNSKVFKNEPEHPDSMSWC